MRVKCMFVTFVIFCSKGHCFKNGYSKETCDDMIPIHEPGEPNVTISSSKCPYSVEIDPKSGKYRRNREMELSIGSKDIKGFQLQFRKSGGDKITRLGEFVNIPSGAKGLQCDDGKATAVTHQDLESKNKLIFKWRAPKEDEGKISLENSFVSGDKYWLDCSDHILECAHFPISVKDCGKNKSCIHYSSDGSDCDGNTCRYLLTYYMPDERTVTFSLSGLTKDQNTYTAVGFKREKDGNLDFITCSRTGDIVSIRHFILDDEKGLFENTADLQNELTDREDDNFWCEFSISLSGTSQVDFSKELESVFAWGKINATSNELIMDKSTWHRAKHNISDVIDKVLSASGSESVSMTAFLHVFLSSLLLIILQA